jgi:hypothetical protein
VIRLSRPAGALLALAAAVSIVSGALPPALAVAVLAPTFLLTPGLLATRAWFAGATGEFSLASAIGLSPFLTGAPLAGCMALGLPLAPVARAEAAVLAVLAMVLLVARPLGNATAPRAVSLLAAGTWTALVTALLVGNPWLPPRSDGWYHAAAALQVLQRGIPPEDPYFAGLRMLYFWGAHVWAAAWLALAPRLSVYTPFVAFNLAAAVAVVLAVAALARRLGAGTRGIALAAFVATMGYSPFGWVPVVARAFTGEVRGWAEISRTVGHGVDPVLFSLAYGELHGSMAFFGDKYLVLTQFSIGLALFVLAALALLELAERPSWTAGVRVGLLAGATLCLHTVVGYSVVIAAGSIAALSIPGTLRGERGSARALAGVALAVAVPVFALVPYLAEITLGKQGHQLSPGVSGRGMMTLLLGGLFTVGPALAWLVRHLRRSPDGPRLLVLALVFCAMSLALKLPENNQSKFFNLLFVLLAAPAGLAWDEGLRAARPRTRALLLALLFVGTLPTVTIAVWGFASERGQTPAGYRPPSAALASAMRWAREHTPADAAFCDLGGGRELLTLAGRSTVWGGFSGERDFGYGAEAIEARRELAGALCRGREPGPAGAALLAGLHRDVIVMTRSDAPDSLSDMNRVAARPERFQLLWRNDAVAFWKVIRP